MNDYMIKSFITIKRKVIPLMMLFMCFSASIEEQIKTIHVFVALCDNTFQGIVPVPETLGNGKDPKNNLYWGAAYGVKTYFNRSQDWQFIKTIESENPYILERILYKHYSQNVYLLAQAYDKYQKCGMKWARKTFATGF